MYIIKRIDKNIELIDDKLWEIAQVAPVTYQNWKQYEYVPNTYARLLYNDYRIYVQLSTDEKPLLARFTNQNDMVCKDSCMELFIRPNENDKRYLNFEFNPFGTMYFAIRTTRYDPEHPIEDKNYFKVQSRVEADKWTLQFVIPFEFIDRVYGTHTKIMYGNLYKCGEETVKEHYASFYPVDPSRIDFQLSEYFGEFILE